MPTHIEGLTARVGADVSQYQREMGRLPGIARRNMGAAAGAATRAFKRIQAAATRASQVARRAMIGLAAGLTAAAYAATKQEDADRRLAASLHRVGVTGRDVMKDMKAYAASIQQVTVYGDEVVEGAMTGMVNMASLSGQALKDATKAAIGLAEAYSIDLKTASLLVGRAAMGQTQMLTRYGIVVDMTASKQEQFNQLLKIGAGFFTLAEERAKTTAGQFLQLKNAAGDLLEAVGQVTLGIGQSGGALGDLVTKVQSVTDAIRNLSPRTRDLIQSILKWTAVTLAAIVVLPKLLALLWSLSVAASASWGALAGGVVGMAAAGIAAGYLIGRLRGLVKAERAYQAALMDRRAQEDVLTRRVQHWVKEGSAGGDPAKMRQVIAHHAKLWDWLEGERVKALQQGNVKRARIAAAAQAHERRILQALLREETGMFRQRRVMQQTELTQATAAVESAYKRQQQIVKQATDRITALHREAYWMRIRFAADEFTARMRLIELGADRAMEAERKAAGRLDPVRKMPGRLHLDPGKEARLAARRAFLGTPGARAAAKAAKADAEARLKANREERRAFREGGAEAVNAMRRRRAEEVMGARAAEIAKKAEADKTALVRAQVAMHERMAAAAMKRGDMQTAIKHHEAQRGLLLQSATSADAIKKALAEVAIVNATILAIQEKRGKAAEAEATKAKDLLAKLDEFIKKARAGVTLKLNTAGAVKQLDALIGGFKRLAKAANIKVAAGGGGAVPEEKAGGGWVRGAPGIDRVPAYLTSGEFVVPAKQAKFWAPLLEAIRSGGGAVDQSQTVTANFNVGRMDHATDVRDIAAELAWVVKRDSVGLVRR